MDNICITSRLDDVVVFRYGNLQRRKVMALIDLDVLVVDAFVLSKKVEAFDCHGVRLYCMV